MLLPLVHADKLTMGRTNCLINAGLISQESVTHQWSCYAGNYTSWSFQELDLNLAGMALNKQSASPFENTWLWLLEASMERLLNPSSVRSGTLRRWVKRSGGGFKRLSIVRLAGLLLVVYVSNRLSQQAIISDIAIQSVPTGMFNLMVCFYSCLDFFCHRDFPTVNSIALWYSSY